MHVPILLEKFAQSFLIVDVGLGIDDKYVISLYTFSEISVRFESKAMNQRNVPWHNVNVRCTYTAKFLAIGSVNLSLNVTCFMPAYSSRYVSQNLVASF